ncbi:MAG: hypothetical protein IPM58_00555 [Nitrospira sp.]|nr:hypothetical protein [Nitrospira sp.]
MKRMNLASMLLLMFSTMAAAASVELVAFADKDFCEKVARLSGARFLFESRLSQTVQWEAIDLKGDGPAVRRCSSLDKTILDLDNDGRKDLVVKTTFCMKGDPSDSLYIFPAESAVLEDTSWLDLSPLLAAHDKFERTGGVYPLTALEFDKGQSSPALTTTFSVHPFILDGTTYVGLTDGRREWLVVAKYRGKERLEDVCYLRSAN